MTNQESTVVDFDNGTPPNPGGQAAFVDDWQHRHVALEGGQGSGKTWAGARKLLTLHMYNGFFDAAGVMDDLHADPTRYDEHYVQTCIERDGQPTLVASAIIAATYSQARDYDIPEMRAALHEAGLAYTWRAQDFEFHLHDFGMKDQPSKIIVRTADKPEAITGWQAGGIWPDEAARFKDNPDPMLDPLIQISGRLRHPFARFTQEMFTYTNEGVDTGVYRRFHIQDDGKYIGQLLPGHALYRASARENPTVRQFVEEQARLLTKEQADQYIDGAAVDFRGSALYSVFNREIHVTTDLGFNSSIPIALALDFNISPGMHGLLMQFDPDRDIFTVKHEIHEKRMDVRGLVAALRSMIAQNGLPIGNGKTLDVFGDASGTSQNAATGESCYGVLAEALDAAGIDYRYKVPKANPPVVDRINAVNAALLDMSGGIHVRIHPSCKRLIADLSGMRRNAKGEISKADKALSHSSDAFGYAVHYQRPAIIHMKWAPGRIGFGGTY